MDKLSLLLKDYHSEIFSAHGATAQGVNWGDETELQHRYDKMLRVLGVPAPPLPQRPSLLDVGCGWGGLASRIEACNVNVDYHGVDIVEAMIDYGRSTYPNATFMVGDIFEMTEHESYDFVVGNGVLIQKRDITIPEMERFTKMLIRKMFDLCRRGIAFNMMSTKVNFTVGTLYYQSPVELLSWLLTEISPCVVLDHGYSSLASGIGKYYDFTVYVYK